MAHNVAIIRGRQLAIRREMDRRGVALKAVAFDSGLEYPTLLTYFPGGDREPATIPGSAIYALCDAVRCGSMPGDLLSLLLPDGFLIVRAPEGVDHDELARHALAYAAEHAAARHPDGECGIDIGPNEHARLTGKSVQLKAVA